MDVLIYLQGILADLVVADLNPDCGPPPPESPGLSAPASLEPVFLKKNKKQNKKNNPKQTNKTLICQLTHSCTGAEPYIYKSLTFPLYSISSHCFVDVQYLFFLCVFLTWWLSWILFSYLTEGMYCNTNPDRLIWVYYSYFTLLKNSRPIVHKNGDGPTVIRSTWKLLMNPKKERTFTIRIIKAVMLTFQVSSFATPMWVTISRCAPPPGNVSSSANAIAVVSLRGRALCFTFFIEGMWNLHLSSCAASLHGWKGGGAGGSECVKWARDCKSLPPVYAAASKGTRTASPQTYWFISHPGYVFRAAKDLLLLTAPCFETRRTSGADSFPSQRRGKTGVAARVAARVLVVIAREPVNHTISAQMPLGQQLPATAIKCRWYRWPNSSRPFYSLSEPRAQIMGYIGRHWIPTWNLFQRHVLIPVVWQS